MKNALVVGGVVAALSIGFAAPADLGLSGALFGASTVEAQAAPASAAARHVMEGRVTKVDAKRGWIDVKTQEGSMKLHFPPSALEGVKTGDSVSVELAMTTSPAADRAPKTK